MEKPENEFGNNRRRADGKQHYCKPCGKDKDRKHYASSETRRKSIRKNASYRWERAKEYILKYLLTHPCLDCGEKDPCVLQFDHIGSKTHAISKLLYRGSSIEIIQAEIEKCEVRCANCHTRKTANQFGWWKRSISITGDALAS